MISALLLHVTLAFPSARPISPAAPRTAVAEAHLLWSPYGVAIDPATAGGAPGDREVLTVVVVETPRPSGGGRSRRPLGSMGFRPDGTPAPVIAVFLADILWFISGARVLGALDWQWPPTMREQILRRVLGCVIAHEVGHYVLRSPRHGREGLMKPLHVGGALAGFGRHGFALSKAEAARVALVAGPGAGR